MNSACPVGHRSPTPRLWTSTSLWTARNQAVQDSGAPSALAWDPGNT